MFNKCASLKLRENLFLLESFDQEINQIFFPVKHNSPGLDKPSFKEDQQTEVVQANSLSSPEDIASGAEVKTELKFPAMESEPHTEPVLETENVNSSSDAQAMDSFSAETKPVFFPNGIADVEAKEKQDDSAPNTNSPTGIADTEMDENQDDADANTNTQK